MSTRADFAADNGFALPLLSDEDGAVAREFGVKRRFGPLPVKRHTLVIGRDRRGVEVHRDEFRMSAHADRPSKRCVGNASSGERAAAARTAVRTVRPDRQLHRRPEP